MIYNTSSVYIANIPIANRLNHAHARTLLMLHILFCYIKHLIIYLYLGGRNFDFLYNTIYIWYSILFYYCKIESESNVLYV